MYRIKANKLSRIVFTLEEDTLLIEDSVLEEMIENGMDMVRIELITNHYRNFTDLISKIYSVASSKDLVVSIILEIPANYRVALGSGDVNVDKGDMVLLAIGEETPDIELEVKEIFRLNIIESEISKGEEIIFGDDLRGEIVNFTSQWILVKILDAGTIYNKSRLKIKGICKITDEISTKQLENISYACNAITDYVAFSFSPSNYIEEFKRIKSSLNPRTKIIGRLEEYISSPVLDELIKMTDGILVARYPMGIEMPIEKICTYQKEIVKKCNEYAKPVLISGHVLGSLRSLPYPLRADACDVYNGVIDGVDGFVLSSGVVGENSWRNTLEMLKNILATAEKEIEHANLFKNIWNNRKPSIKESVASSAVKTAIELNASFIVVITEVGEMLRLVAKYRPPIPIFCISKDSAMAQQAVIYRGSIPIVRNFDAYEKVADWVRENLSGTVVIVTDSESSNQLIGITSINS